MSITIIILIWLIFIFVIVLLALLKRRYKYVSYNYGFNIKVILIILCGFVVAILFGCQQKSSQANLLENYFQEGSSYFANAQYDKSHEAFNNFLTIADESDPRYLIVIIKKQASEIILKIEKIRLLKDIEFVEHIRVRDSVSNAAWRGREGSYLLDSF